MDYAASEIYNELLRTCFEDYCYDLPVAEKALDHKYKPKTLFLEAYDYKPWFYNSKFGVKEESTDGKKDEDLS